MTFSKTKHPCFQKAQKHAHRREINVGCRQAASKVQAASIGGDVRGWKWKSTYLQQQVSSTSWLISQTTGPAVQRPHGIPLQ